MRVASFMCLVFLCTQLGYSQRTLQPQAVIKAFKEQNQTFEVFAPFSNRSQLRSQDYSEISSDLQVYQLDPNVFQRMLAQQPERMRLQLPAGQRSIELELFEVDVLAGSNFQLATSDGRTFSADQLSGRHYRGVIKGEEGSLVALSLFADQLTALIASPERGNLVLTEVDDQPGEYLLYESTEMDQRRSLDCATPDSYEPYRAEELAPQADLRSAGNCVNVYLEIDYDVYQDKGGVDETAGFIIGIFNEVATLYANENINLVLSKLLIWTGESPYTDANSYEMLRQFQSERTSIDGDIGQLISYKSSGGIAIVDGLCQSRTEYKLSFASISRSYRQVPVFSYTVMVVAHELGHLLGSQHTHACVWNGNSTAIDGCAGTTEGDCAVPDIPSNGGTIMSYCHITGAGINFSEGFGTQPGNLIRNRVTNASCLVACSTGGGSDNGADSGSGGDGTGSDPGGACVDLSFELVLDLFGSETSWEIQDANGNQLAQGSGYSNKLAGQKYVTSLCLPEGCYEVIVRDSDGDGLCCDYGQGSFTLINTTDGTILAQGAQFSSLTTESFCLSGSGDDGDNNDGGGNDDDNPDAGCPGIDFTQETVLSFGGSQDQGQSEVIENGSGIRLYNNAWKAIKLPYELTAGTRIRFDYKSDNRPELGVIGMDENNAISSNRTFTLYGSQNWGIRNFKNYPGNGEWKTYEIPIGQFYRGQMNYLFFGADHDRFPKDGDAQFRNIYIFEGTFCGNLAETLEAPAASQAGTINVFPNPGNEQVYFDIPREESTASGAQLMIYNTYGQRVKVVPVAKAGRLEVFSQDMAPGTYLYRLEGFESEYTGMFSINR
ncbi:MAG TPA: M12 family metallo-peptidase [Saprospiraceae bacterium]|nr:M12 family metallo-peptidase [Saprospiraceae bacterium]